MASESVSLSFLNWMKKSSSNVKPKSNMKAISSLKEKKRKEEKTIRNWNCLRISITRICKDFLLKPERN